VLTVIDKLLISVLSIIILTAVFMQLLLCGLPFFSRIEFDAICHQYVQKMDQNGGLISDDADALCQQLMNRGFLDISISATDRADYGESMSLLVNATRPGYQMTPSLGMEDQSWLYRYEATLVCRMFKIID
jgi:hypothetical protein